MKRRLLLLLAVATVSVAAGAVAIGSAVAANRPRRASSGAATVSTGHTKKLGTFLVSGTGRTLYLFEKDRKNHSNCSGACAAAWPPLLTKARAKAVHGARANMLGTATRRGGEQVTYAGHPLYMFSGDKKPGQTNGQGSKAFGAAWYVVAPNGKKVDKS
jgi:predicted lipoprotein with Yx(FWY)xxD motif